MDGHLEMNVVERDVPVEVERPNVENAQVTIARPPAEEEQTPNDVVDANAEPWSPSQLNRALLSQAWKLHVPSPKKLLILDVNGLLVARYSKIDRSVIPMDTPHGVVSKSFMFKRPYCDSFLAFCFENFDVGLWSSMMQANVFRALDFICQGWQDKCRFVMHQGDCTNTGLRNPEKKKQPLFLKELANVWSKFPQFNETNTLLIDDTPYKALRNPPYTAIFPEAYLYNEADIFLKGPLVEYLTQLRDAADVREFVRAHPIGLPALAPGSLHWDIYQKVLETKAEKVSPLQNTHPLVALMPKAAPTGWDSPPRDTHHLEPVVPRAAPTGWDSPPRDTRHLEPVVPRAAPTGWDSPPRDTRHLEPVVPRAAPTGWDSPPRDTHHLEPVVPQAAPTGWDSPPRDTRHLEPVVPRAVPTGWDSPPRDTRHLEPVVPRAAPTGWDSPPSDTRHLEPVVPRAAPTGWDSPPRDTRHLEPVVPRAAPTGWDSPPHNTHHHVPVPQAAPTGWDSPPRHTHHLVPVVPQATSTGWDSQPYNTHHHVPVVPQATSTGWDSQPYNTHHHVPVVPQATSTGWDSQPYNTHHPVTSKPQAAPTGWDSPPRNTHHLVPVVTQAAPSGWNFVERDNEFGEPLPPGTY